MQLSKDRDEAQRLFHELKAENDARPPEAVAVPLGQLAEQYLVTTRAKRFEDTDVRRSDWLRRFVAHAGAEVEAGEVKPLTVTAWCASNPQWSPSTESMVWRLVKALFNWAVREGHLRTNPVASMTLGASEHRDRLLSAEDRRRIRAAVPREYADFLAALEWTGDEALLGAGEAHRRGVGFDAGTATLRTHKTRKKRAAAIWAGGSSAGRYSSAAGLTTDKRSQGREARRIPAAEVRTAGVTAARPKAAASGYAGVQPRPARAANRIC